MTFSFKHKRGVIYNSKLNKEYDLDDPKDVIQLCYEMNNLEKINRDLYWELKSNVR